MRSPQIPLFESFANKCLIVVDVQKPFSKWWVKNGKSTLVNDIVDYAHGFSDVCQVWDDHDEESPSYNFPNQSRVIRKTYGTNVDASNYKDRFDGEALRVVSDMFDSDIFEPKLIKNKVGCYDLYVGGSHKWFSPSIEMVDALEGIPHEIVLVGGAEGECLYDIEVLLQVLGKKFSVNNTYTYNATDVGTSTVTEGFDSWFDGSSVVDAAGNPLVVFSGKAIPNIGVCYSNDKHIFRDNSNVNECYISVKKPFRCFVEDYINHITHPNSPSVVVLKDKLISEGYDGIMYGNGVVVPFMENQVKLIESNTDVVI